MKAEIVVNVDAEQKAQSLQDQVLKLVKDAKSKVRCVVKLAAVGRFFVGYFFSLRNIYLF